MSKNSSLEPEPTAHHHPILTDVIPSIQRESAEIYQQSNQSKSILSQNNEQSNAESELKLERGG